MVTFEVVFKFCNGCKKDIPIEGFHNDKSSKDGKQNKCKCCQNTLNTKWRETHRGEHRKMNKSYYVKKIEKITIYQESYRSENREKIRLRNRLAAREKRSKLTSEEKQIINEKKQLYREQNKDKVKAYKKKYNLEKPQGNRTGAKKRKLQKKQRVPIWADHAKIREVYRNCPHGMEVDHIIPLMGKTVCGLHVHENMQYLTPEDNKMKSNKW